MCDGVFICLASSRTLAKLRRNPTPLPPFSNLSAAAYSQGSSCRGLSALNPSASGMGNTHGSVSEMAIVAMANKTKCGKAEIKELQKSFMAVAARQGNRWTVDRGEFQEALHMAGIDEVRAVGLAEPPSWRRMCPVPTIPPPAHPLDSPESCAALARGFVVLFRTRYGLFRTITREAGLAWGTSVRWTRHGHVGVPPPPVACRREFGGFGVSCLPLEV